MVKLYKYIPYKKNMPKLNETQTYVEPADDFYWKLGKNLENAEEFNKMWSLYNQRLNQILEKDYEDSVWKSLWERLLKQVIRDWNKIQFFEYLKYLVDSWQISSENSFDDVDQIWELQDQLKSLREEVEEMWNRDFTVVWWNMDWMPLSLWDFEYLWNNTYSLKVDFEKIKRKKVGGFLKLSRTYRNSSKILLQYDWTQEIKFYYWDSRNDINRENYIWTTFLWDKVIDVTDIRNRRRWNTRIREEQVWARHQVYFRELDMKLILQFSVN